MQRSCRESASNTIDRYWAMGNKNSRHLNPWAFVWTQYGQVVIHPVKCGMKLFIHVQTSTVQPFNTNYAHKRHFQSRIPSQIPFYLKEMTAFFNMRDWHYLIWSNSFKFPVRIHNSIPLSFMWCSLTSAVGGNGGRIYCLMISNHLPSKVCDRITYPPPNFNGYGVGDVRLNIGPLVYI